MYNKQQHLHFIGIGGVGMAGIAEVLFNLGYSVSGSDLRGNSLTETLAGLGVTISIGHSASNIPVNTDVIVVSSAISKDNPEYLEGTTRGIPIIPRAEMLAELMRMKYGIAVAGSHGKTTTTSMTAKILRDVGHDPTVIVGGRILSDNTGASLGHGEYLVAEADESDGSFCLLRPAIAIVTNIDVEHLSHYGSFGALEEAFASFLSEVPFYGLAVVNGDDPIVARLADALPRRTRSYGLSSDRDVFARDIRFEGPNTRYTLCIRGGQEVEILLPLGGLHMVSNSLAAACVALELGAYPDEIAKSLSTFAGVSRRCEVIFDTPEVLILDDYGHHPTEIRATLGAIRKGHLEERKSRIGGDAKLHVVFEPHRYSRTKELYSEFLESFEDADRLYVADIYPAGESPIDGLSSEGLAQSIRHSSVEYAPEIERTLGEIAQRVQPGDIIVTLGAGSISSKARELAQLILNK